MIQVILVLKYGSLIVVRTFRKTKLFFNFQIQVEKWKGIKALKSQYFIEIALFVWQLFPFKPGIFPFYSDFTSFSEFTNINVVTKSFAIIQIYFIPLFLGREKWVNVYLSIYTQLTFTCSNSAIQTVEKGVKYVKS